MTEPTIGTASVTHTGWRRTRSSFMEGDPPHRHPDETYVRLDMIWGDAQRTIPLAATDVDGCIAVVAEKDETA